MNQNLRGKEAYRELVDVNFHEVDVGVFGGQRIEGRRHDLAGPTPRRSEIHHHLINQEEIELGLVKDRQSYQIGED